MFRYMPEQASDFAPNVDWLNNWITDISLFCLVAICAVMLYYAIRYRHRPGVKRETPQILTSHFLEITWTVIPTLICIFIAFYGVVYYRDMRDPPSNTLDIQVWGKKWDWRFEYPNGKKTFKEFTVPVNQPIRLVMKSEDVLHSFFIPAMRVKKDVLPSEYTYLWFRPVKVGTYQTFCTEYCGTNHSAMLAKVHVVSQAEYDRWLNDNSEELIRLRTPPGEVGKKLFTERGCNACHSLDGSRLVGPSFKGLWGKDERLVGGATAKVDENYVQESILNPNAKVVEGYAPVMPAFAGQLNDQEISALIAFIKDVEKYSTQPTAATVAATTTAAAVQKDPATMTPVERGEKIYREKLCVSCHSIDGSRLVGPSLKGVVGRSGKLADGSSYTADEAYLKESILNSTAKVVEGYPPAMPPYAGQLSDSDIADVIAFMKSL